jgi:hypothetical protein
MIPSHFDDRTPPGERAVFRLLALGPMEWVVLHSLDLAPWNRGLRTEVDFVVVVPDTGILCIEVKSHREISFDGTRWHPSDIRRSPFKQAADGRFTFYRRIRDLIPGFARVPVGHCCIFPEARFELAPNLSVQPWELMDARTFDSLREPDRFCTALKSLLICCIDADASMPHLAAPLSDTDLSAMIHACVPIQRYRPSVRDEVRQREEQATAVLRDQQRPVLRLAELNERLVVSGGAGTGKTLIAMELARRAADRGHRVALLCFNQLVGEWIRQHTVESGHTPPHLVIGRAIRVMADMAGVAIPQSPLPSFWDTELPELLEERLTDPDLKATAAFDCLILDEAQDFLSRPRLWGCLSQFLRGGLTQGSFVLLGDFDHQVLHDHEHMRKTLAELETSVKPARWHLAENCRNYRIIGETALKLGGLPDTVYTGYLRPSGGLHNYDIHFYTTESDQLTQLAEWLRRLKADGYHSSDITILSFRGDDTCAASHLARAGYKIRPAWRAGHGTSFASIHAFKGMENKVIILTDVLLSQHDFHRDLFYTGMTRATECVRVLCDQASTDTLYTWLCKGASQ